MPVFDNECPECGRIFETVTAYGEHSPCPKCGSPSNQIITASGQFCANQDAPWIRSVLDVVDKDSTAPHVREFLRNPTRDTHRAWMKGEGIRPMEGEEKSGKREMTDRDREQINRECADNLMRHNRIEMRS